MNPMISCERNRSVSPCNRSLWEPWLSRGPTLSSISWHKSASSILQALSCRFVGYNLFVPGFICPRLAFRICWVSFGSPRRPTKLKKRLVRAHFRQRQAHWLLTLRPTMAMKKAHRHFVQYSDLDFDFLEITSLLGLLNCNRQSQQNRACSIELRLADLS